MKFLENLSFREGDKLFSVQFNEYRNLSFEKKEDSFKLIVSWCFRKKF